MAVATWTKCLRMFRLRSNLTGLSEVWVQTRCLESLLLAREMIDQVMKLFDRRLGACFGALCRQQVMSARLEAGFDVKVSRITDADQQHDGYAIIADLDQE